MVSEMPLMQDIVTVVTGVGFMSVASLQCRRIWGARVHIFVLGRHLGFSNSGGLGRGDIRRGSRG